MLLLSLPAKEFNVLMHKIIKIIKIFLNDIEYNAVVLKFKPVCVNGVFVFVMTEHENDQWILMWVK